jgi:hypothetical protein
MGIRVNGYNLLYIYKEDVRSFDVEEYRDADRRTTGLRVESAARAV